MKEKIYKTKFSDEFLKASWQWMNDKELVYLIDGPRGISKEGQIKWFESLANKSDYKLWGLKIKDTPVGAFGLKAIKEDKAEYFGYIGDKQYWGKGYGQSIIQFAVEEAQELELGQIYLEVINENKRAIKAYLKAGFEIIKADQSKTYMGLWLK